MAELLSNVDPGLPLVLVLLALLGFRMRVSPSASLHIAASPARIFDVIDFQDGNRQRWHRGDVSVALVDPATRTYTIRYTQSRMGGSPRLFEASFRVAERDASRYLLLERAGLEGRSRNSELLAIETTLAPEGTGTRATLRYHWGPRPLIAQLLARTDMWATALRLKSFVETGEAGGRAESWISAGVAIGTGLLTLAGFGLWFGFDLAVMLVVALLVHEFGHLLAFRLTGQGWGRLLFLPFLGALAMPRQSFDSQGQSVFAALMGPGFSLLLPALAFLAFGLDMAAAPWLLQLGLVAAALNLFNLLPVEPLDGGVALRSVFSRLIGGHARFALIAVGLLICLAGWHVSEPLLLVFGGIAVLANLKPRQIDHGLEPMRGLGVALSIAFFVMISALHLMALSSLSGFGLPA